MYKLNFQMKENKHRIRTIVDVDGQVQFLHRLVLSMMKIDEDICISIL